MKTALKLLIIVLALIPNLKAKAASQELQGTQEFSEITYEDHDKNQFLDCTLADGQKLTATYSMVYIGSKVLSKTSLFKSITPTADYVHYSNNGINVAAYKQFSGREGYQGALVTDESGQKTDLRCIEKNEE